MSAVPLAEAGAEHRFGGKAAQLAGAIGAGLPVPPGFALEVEVVERVVAGDAAARAWCRHAYEALGAGAVAVRSSAVGEDSAQSSFAGQHLTCLGVTSTEQLIDAVARVHASGRSPAALAYRERLGIDAPARVAVIVQQMIDADCAGVLFTRNPVDGADERIIEAMWGLGEAVVAGLGEPDRWRMRRGGHIVEATIGDKDVAVRPVAGGGTETVAVDGARAAAPCLNERALGLLEELAARCEAHFPGAHDIEWAFRGEELFLLQRRAVTR